MSHPMRIPLQKAVTVAETLNVLGDTAQSCLGRADRLVTAIASISGADVDAALCFCSATGELAEREIAATKASVIICRPEVAECAHSTQAEKTLISAENPRLAFIRLIDRLAPIRYVDTNVGKSAVIAPSARIACGVSIGEAAVISEDCEIGEGTMIDAGVVLYPRTVI